MYFDETELTWKVGNRVGSERVRMRAHSLATTPDLIGSQWQVYRMYIDDFSPAPLVKSVCADHNQNAMAAEGAQKASMHVLEVCLHKIIAQTNQPIIIRPPRTLSVILGSPQRLATLTTETPPSQGSRVRAKNAAI